MVEMSVAGIALDAASRSPIVLLRDPSGRRQVPIWIDQAQAQNILAGLHIKEPPRPLSHDLMATLMAVGGLELNKVVIHAIEDSTFHAVLKLSDEDHYTFFMKIEDKEFSVGLCPRHLQLLFAVNAGVPGFFFFFF